jgi:hypothetical protein
MPPFELYFLTFNCARCLVDPATLGPHIFDAHTSITNLPDIVVISLQEIAPIAYSFLGDSYLQPYYDRVTVALHVATIDRGGNSQTYRNIATRNIGMTALMVFAKEALAGNIHQIRTAVAGVGLWDMGNKGAVGVRLSHRSNIDDRSLDFTFIAAHLAPMEMGVRRRNQDWENIVRNMVFVHEQDERPHAAEAVENGTEGGEEAPLLSRDGDETSKQLSGLFQKRNYVFIAGDLNYRTSDTPPGPKSHFKYPQPVDSDASPKHFTHFLQRDQLTRERNAGRTFHGFGERPITFPPTYKYSSRRLLEPYANPQTEQQTPAPWIWAKHRFPSWCDRILFLPPPPSAPDLIFHKYISLPIQPTSDHQPVALSVAIGNERTASNPDQPDIREQQPFPLNPNWHSRLSAARQKEVIVGIAAYLTLTREGIPITLATALVALAAWYMTGGHFR